MRHKNLLALVVSLSLSISPVLAATLDMPIATINARQILAESKVAKEALVKFQAEFASRDGELQGLASILKEKSMELEKVAPSLSPSQVMVRQTELDELSREFKRKQMQFVEDRDARKRDDIQKILSIATRTVNQFAEAAQIEIVFENFVYANPKTDITARVIESMDAQTTK